jgi:hypothetical protein
MDYTPPKVTELGSVRDLTLADGFNKIGFSQDVYSANTPLLGSIVDARPL